MSLQEDQFLNSLRATFKVEADEHLQTIVAGLLALEKTAVVEEQRRIVDTVFRAAHSLKGAARAVNLREIETVCQAMEDVFAIWKRQQTPPASQTLDKMHRAVNTALKVLGALDAPHPGNEPGASQAHLANPPLPVAVQPPSLPPPPLPARTEETVRIAISKLDAQLLEAEEMLAVKLMARQRATELREVVDQFQKWKERWAGVHAQTRALCQSRERNGGPQGSFNPPGLDQMAAFLEWNQDFLRSFENKLQALSKTASRDTQTVGKLVDDLLVDSKKLLMLPLSTLGTLFPKLVRDLCHDQGKDADFILRGENVEIDKRILEEMKDPLIHLLRNCVDHGVEPPDQRLKQGKPARATITLFLVPIDGDKVEISVADDGRGINLADVKQSAVKHGIISREEAGRLSEADAMALIFKADVSTSPIITQVSGRGLGLAIVREATEKLGGSLSAESRLGKGTRIHIIVPVALATFRGIQVRAEGRLFVVPMLKVESVLRFKPEDAKPVEGRKTLLIQGTPVALVSLADILELPPAQRQTGRAESAHASAIIVRSGTQRIAFAVDEVLEEHEVLIKRLCKPLARVRNIAGAAISGSGQVVPILNPDDLLKSARKGAHSQTRAPQPVQAENKSILIVEDSITSRMLLKNIIESAGYKVKTAVDGIDGFTTLRAEKFELVVSDVEMPRMNGFDLTAKIRADKTLSELPVVLVTALEKREDRERGIDVGASAYLVKSGFDQGNLLETIRRLI